MLMPSPIVAPMVEQRDKYNTETLAVSVLRSSRTHILAQAEKIACRKQLGTLVVLRLNNSQGTAAFARRESKHHSV